MLEENLDALTEHLDRARLGARDHVAAVGVTTSYRIPETMWLDEDSSGQIVIAWRWADGKHSLRNQPQFGALSEFAKLHDAQNDPQRVLQFARRFGLLGFCQHFNGGESGRGPGRCSQCTAEVGLPQDFPSVAATLQAASEMYRAGLVGGAENLLRILRKRQVWPAVELAQLASPEPVSAWVENALRVKSFLTFIASLRMGEAAEITDALGLFGVTPAEAESSTAVREVLGLDFVAALAAAPDSESGKSDLAWETVSRKAGQWIFETAGVRSSFSRVPGSDFLQLSIVGRGLLGALALELASLLTAPKGVYRCDHCGALYTLLLPDDDINKKVRTPSRGSNRKHYCHACRADNYRVVRAARARERYKRDHPQARGRVDQRSSVERVPVVGMISA
jgi:hypothetical protein